MRSRCGGYPGQKDRQNFTSAFSEVAFWVFLSKELLTLLRTPRRNRFLCPLIGSKLDDSKDDALFMIPNFPPKEEKTKRVLKHPEYESDVHDTRRGKALRGL